MATYNINPLYVGVFDLRNTAASAAIQSVNIADRGAWVGLGDRLPTALLLESDMVDPASFNEAQTMARIDAFIEVVKEKAKQRDWKPTGKFGGE